MDVFTLHPPADLEAEGAGRDEIEWPRSASAGWCDDAGDTAPRTSAAPVVAWQLCDDW